MTRTTRAHRFAAAAVAAVLWPMSAGAVNGGGPAVIGYLPDYRALAALLRNLNGDGWSGLTQVNYFSVEPNAGTGDLPGTGGQAAVSSGGCALSQLSTVVAAAHAHGVKVEVVVGGAGLDGSLQSVIGGSTSLRRQFAQSVKRFAAAYGVDGVDLDWEPSSATPAQIAGYGTLIRTVKATATGLTVSAAVNAEQSWLADGGRAYVLNATAVQGLDAIAVMAYDLRPGAGSSPASTAEADLAAWGTYVAANGGSKGRLLLGIPFYGHADDAANTAVNYGAIVTGYTGTPADLGDRRVVDGSTVHFNGPTTIAAKTSYALTGGYGGVAAWELGQDSFTATGGYTTHALLPVVRKTVAAYEADRSPTVTRWTGKVIGTAGSYGDGGNTAAKAFDGDVGTFFDAPAAGTTAAPNWVGLDLGSAQRVTQLSYAPRAHFAGRMVGGSFQASNSPTFATGNVTLATVIATPAAGTTTVTVGMTGCCRYVRYVAPPGGYGNVAEVAFYGPAATTRPN